MYEDTLKVIKLIVAFIAVTKLTLVVCADPPSHLQKLEQAYGNLKNESCQVALTRIPSLPANDTENFMQAYRNFTGAAGEDEGLVMNAALTLLSLTALHTFLSLPASFASGGLDYHLVRCKVLNESTPLGLAEFAVQSPSNEALVAQLLGNGLLMRDMLVAGGASSGNFGQAMKIFAQLLNASRDTVQQHAETPPPAIQCTTTSPGHNHSCIHNPWGVLAGFPKTSSNAKECCDLCQSAVGCVSWTFFGQTCNAFRYIDARSKLNQGSCISGGQLPSPPAPPPPSPGPPPPHPKPPEPPVHPWDDRSQATILRRLALGTALEFAVPIKHMMVDTYIDPVQRCVECVHTWPKSNCRVRWLQVNRGSSFHV